MAAARHGWLLAVVLSAGCQLLVGIDDTSTTGVDGPGGDSPPGPDGGPGPDAGGFALEVEPTAFRVARGSDVLAGPTITIAREPGFTEPVLVTIEDVVAGVYLDPSPFPIPGAAASLPVRAGLDAALGPDNVIIRATAGSFTAEVPALLTVVEPPGTLDASFCTGGRIALEPGGETAPATALALEIGADGLLLVGGDAGTIYRVRPQDCSLDPTFGAGGWIGIGDQDVIDLAVRPDGTILALARPDPPWGFSVRRYTASGQPAGTFSYPSGLARALAVDGAGRATVLFRDGACSALRLTADLLVDPIFAWAGLTDQCELLDAAATPDDAVLVAGRTHGSDASGFFTARLLADTGALDGTFAPTTFGPEASTAFALALPPPPHDRVVLGGQLASGTVAVAARLARDGGPDPTFDGDGLAAPIACPGGGTFHSVAVQPDGRVLAAGQCAPTVGGPQLGLLARFAVDGAIDPTFPPRFYAGGPSGPSGALLRVAVAADGKIVVAGNLGDGGYLVMRVWD